MDLANKLPLGIIDTTRAKFAIEFFKMSTSHIHFWSENTNSIQDGGKATKPQIEYAQQLGIDNPEQYTKQELSQLISDKL